MKLMVTVTHQIQHYLNRDLNVNIKKDHVEISVQKNWIKKKKKKNISLSRSNEV